MTLPIMDDGHRKIVDEILDAYLPGNTKVFVFGSRANGRPRRMSDLDLLLDARQPLPLAMLATLHDAFDESDLIWKVDIVDRATASPAFLNLIEADLVALR